MDHKYLSYTGLKRFFYTKILKQINLKIDKTNGDISNTKVRSVDTISTEFPDPVAGESTKTFLGKVKKCLADWKAIKSTLLTLSMLTNQYENSTSKIPTAALVYALNQSLATTNSNLNNLNAFVASCCKSIIVQDIYFENSQTATVTVTSGVDHVIAVVESGVAIGVLSCTCTNKTSGHFYIVLNEAYTGTLKIAFYIFK